MTTIAINKAVIMAATTHLSLGKKEALASTLAESCIRRCGIAVADDSQSLPIPPFYKRDSGVTTIFEALVLLRYYLRLDGFTGDSEAKMTVSEYDASGIDSVLAQMGALSQQDPECKEKIAAICADFEDFRTRLNEEIRSLLDLQNDPCTRLMAMFAMQTTPAAVKAGLEGLKSVSAELESVKKDNSPERGR